MTMKVFWDTYWEQHRFQDMPWYTGRPDHNLVSYLQTLPFAPKNVLDLGCGIGDNAIWLAQQGIKVTACDIATKSIDLARQRANDNGVSDIDFCVIDVLDDSLPAGDFDMVFDRGLLHQFNLDHDRARVCQSISQVLAPRGVWLSIIGSTEMAKTQQTPPRRSARDIVSAVEPYLRIERLQATTEEMVTEIGPQYCSAWLLVARHREHAVRPWIPASQADTRG